ncbi:MAG: hypothetical protein ABW202_08100 [Duganella sp.]
MSHIQAPTDFERRVHLVGQAISQAAQASSAEHHLPSELRDSINRVDRLSDQVRALLLAGEQARVGKLVADMATQASRARRVCTNIAGLSAQLRGAVNHMYSQILELQRDLQ